MRYIFLFFFFSSCIQKRENSNQISNHAKQVKADSLSVQNKNEVDTFDIETLIPEYKNNASFKRISSLSIGRDIHQNVIYSTYILQREKAINIINNLKPKTKSISKNKADLNMQKVDSSIFFKSVYDTSIENSAISKSFYNKIRSLKNYDIFCFSTYGYLHWIFFDKSSDTIYQRTVLITY